MLPVIADSVRHKNNNADAAQKFAEWAHTAPLNLFCWHMLIVMMILILTILSLGLWVSWIVIILGSFCVTAMIWFIRGFMKDAEK